MSMLATQHTDNKKKKNEEKITQQNKKQSHSIE